MLVPELATAASPRECARKSDLRGPLPETSMRDLGWGNVLLGPPTEGRAREKTLRQDQLGCSRERNMPSVRQGPGVTADSVCPEPRLIQGESELRPSTRQF